MLTLSLAALAAVTTFLSSCKDDEEVPNAKLSVSSAAQTVAEGQQLTVSVVLDRAAPADITVDYTLTGTATRQVGTTVQGDYSVSGTVGEIDIQSGQTTGEVTFTILEDMEAEGNETITFAIDDVSSDRIDLTTDDVTEITVTDNSPTVSFAQNAATYNEDDGTVAINLTLSRALTTAATIEYELSPWSEGDQFIAGAAVDAHSAEEMNLSPEFWDYGIQGGIAPVSFAAGQTTATINVVLLSDFQWEDTETFDITLKSTSTLAAGATNTITVSIGQEDGMLVFMAWPETNATTGQADMDLFVRVGENVDPVVWDGLVTASAYHDFEYPFEYVLIPKIADGTFLLDPGYADTRYGFSYNYYDGNMDPLEFEVAFVELTNGELEAEADADVFTGTYTAANKNKWVSPTFPTIVTQTMRLNNGVFSDISPLTIPAQGSRVAPKVLDLSAFAHAIREQQSRLTVTAARAARPVTRK